MRAVRYHQYGDPEVLQVEEAPEPHAPDGAVRIKTLAASVNPIDWQIRAGSLRDNVDIDFPVTVGRDAVGVVDEIGAGALDAEIGEVVFGLGGVQDTWGEFAVLTAWSAPPPTWTTAQAAAAGLASATAFCALRVFGPLAGRTILLEGATGAVGSAAVVVARSQGARVIGSGRTENHEYLRSLGAEPVLYGPSLKDSVAALAPDGVDIAIDLAGAGSLEDLVDITGDATRTATVTDPVGATRLGSHLVFAENDSTILRAAAALGGEGLYLPRVAETVSLGDAAHAHRIAETSSRGKVVICF